MFSIGGDPRPPTLWSILRNVDFLAPVVFGNIDSDVAHGYDCSMNEKCLQYCDISEIKLLSQKCFISEIEVFQD